MNIMDFTITTDRVLKKLFGTENVHKVTCNINASDSNRVYFVVSLKDKKFTGFIFHSYKLSVKDIRNILFAYKRNLFDLLAKEAKNVNTSNEEVCPKLYK